LMVIFFLSVSFADIVVLLEGNGPLFTV